jgi:alkylation response protein AidB-like acyl-CoA dehydrogenase
VKTSNASLVIDSIQSLKEEIKSRSREIEDTRHLPADIYARLKALGVFYMTVPATLGGGEATASEVVRIIEELSSFDGSTGWNAMIHLTSGVNTGLLPKACLDQLFASTDIPVIAGATAPTGRGREVDGGIEVTGTWAWGSGTHNSDWIAGGTLVLEGEDVPKLSTGEPQVHLMFFSRDQVKLHDNWDAFGMQGTGSGDFSVEAAFVPEGRWMVLGASPALQPGPLYRFPFFSLFAVCVCATALGVARRALDEFVDLAATKVPAWQKDTIANNPVVRTDLARAEAEFLSARHFLYETIEAVWDRVSSGSRPELEDRRLLRLAAVHVAETSVKTVQTLYTAAGGSSVHQSNPLQRCLRDVNIVTQHRMVGAANLEIAGGYKLGDDRNLIMF